MTTIVLDNEAVQALLDAGHKKHRLVIAHIDGVKQRRRRGSIPVLVVPTSVRVEAGWDRSDPRAALANRLSVRDDALDTDAANHAAALVRVEGVSVADAHVGAAVHDIDGTDVVVLSSDPQDMRRVVGHRAVTIVRV